MTDSAENFSNLNLSVALLRKFMIFLTHLSVSRRCFFKYGILLGYDGQVLYLPFNYQALANVPGLHHHRNFSTCHSPCHRRANHQTLQYSLPLLFRGDGSQRYFFNRCPCHCKRTRFYTNGTNVF